MHAQPLRKAISACLALSFTLPAFAAKDPDLIPVTSAQVQQLGIETQNADTGGKAVLPGLPAQVVVPTPQLRVVSAPLPGLVEAILVVPGMKVKAGQPIARLASREALELGRDLRQTGAQADLAAKSLQRDELLFKEGLIPESRVQASRAAAAQAQAAAGERKAALALSGGSAEGPALTLRSPIEGVVLEQNANLGQRVDQSAPLFKIGRLSPLWLELQVPGDAAVFAREGQAVRAAGASGKLISVGQAVAGSSQTVTLRAVLTEGTAKLRPGQAVSAELELPGAGTRLPAAALARAEGRTVAFVKQGDAAFRAVNVRTSAAAGDTVQVDGLPAGAAVAVKGTSGLKAMWTGVGRE